MTEIQKLAKLTGETDTDLLALLYEKAEGYVLSATNRATMPECLLNTVLDVAVVAYNRIGVEGETSRSEGGERYSFTSGLPRNITAILNQHRLVRINGVAYEADA